MWHSFAIQWVAAHHLNLSKTLTNWSKYIYLFGYDSPLKMLSSLREGMHSTVYLERHSTQEGRKNHGEPVWGCSYDLLRSSCSNREETQRFAEPYPFLIQNIGMHCEFIIIRLSYNNNAPFMLPWGIVNAAVPGGGTVTQGFWGPPRTALPPIHLSTQHPSKEGL